MKQVSEKRISGPTGVVASFTLTKLLCALAVITLTVTFSTMSTGNAYLNSLGRAGWCGTQSMWRYSQFKNSSILLIALVFPTAILAHIRRRNLDIIRRWSIFFSWGFGAAVLVAYWGILRLL